MLAGLVKESRSIRESYLSLGVGKRYKPRVLSRDFSNGISAWRVGSAKEQNRIGNKAWGIRTGVMKAVN